MRGKVGRAPWTLSSHVVAADTFQALPLVVTEHLEMVIVRRGTMEFEGWFLASRWFWWEEKHQGQKMGGGGKVFQESIKEGNPSKRKIVIGDEKRRGQKGTTSRGDE